MWITGPARLMDGMMTIGIEALHGEIPDAKEIT